MKGKGSNVLWAATAAGRVIELEFNDMSTLVGHFVLSPRERQKRDRRGSRGDKRQRQGRKENE